MLDWMIDRLNDLLIGWLNNLLTYWLDDWLIGWLIRWVDDWLIVWLIDWLIYWLIDWLIDRSSFIFSWFLLVLTWLYTSMVWSLEKLWRWVLSTECLVPCINVMSISSVFNWRKKSVTRSFELGAWPLTFNWSYLKITQDLWKFFKIKESSELYG